MVGISSSPHGDIPRWNLLAPGLLFWFLFVIRWIYVFASLANRLLIDLPLIFVFADVAVVLYQVTFIGLFMLKRSIFLCLIT